MMRQARLWLSAGSIAAVCGVLTLASIDRFDGEDVPDVACQVLPNGIVHPLESIRRACPLERYDRVSRVEIDGVWRYFGGHEDLRRAAGRGAPAVRVEVIRDGAIQQATIPVLAASRVASVGRLLTAGVLALVMLGIALVVLWSSEAAAAVPFVVLYTSASVLLVVSLCGASGRLGLAAVCAWAATAASLTHLALAFPRPRRLLRVAPQIVALPYLIGALLGGAAAAALGRFPELWILTDRALVAASVIAWGLVVLGCALSMKEPGSTLARARARVLLLGTILLPLIPLFGAALLGGNNHREALPLTILAASLAPLPIGYSIVRYELFDLAEHLRRAVAALLQAALAAGLVVLATLVAARLLDVEIVVEESGLLFALTFASVLAGEILRARHRRVLDRFKHPEAERLAVLTQRHARHMATSLDVHACVQTSCTLLAEGLEASGVACFFPSSGDWHLVAASSREALLAPALATEAIRLAGRREILYLAREEGEVEDSLAPLEREGVEIVVPLRYSDRTVAVVLVTASQKGLPYTTPELSFLRTVASQTALAVAGARLAKDLLAAERFAAAGRVSANLAHELGKPVGVIERLAERLPRHMADADRLARETRMIGAAAAELRGIVRSVLDEPLRADDRSVSSAPVSAGALVAHAVSVAERTHGEGRVCVLVSTPARLQATDVTRLERALVNLLDNALYVEPTDGVVAVSVGEADGCVRIVIEDHGAGMSEEVRARAFDPFFTTRADAGGTGLGLGFAREVIEGAGGVIALASAPGGGTRAIVTLPGRSQAKPHAA